jgi:hypothetical protein
VVSETCIRKEKKETHALRAEHHIYLIDQTERDGDDNEKNNQEARPPTARRNASPADCGAESLAKVPAFIDANTFTGFVSFCAGPDDENDGAMTVTELTVVQNRG